MSRLSPRALDAPRVFVRALFILLACVTHVNAKVFERCELALTLHNKHQVALEEVAIWTCIAQHASNFNTDAYAGGRNGGSHGLFQISDVFWCTTSSKHGECDIPCESLRDADLSNDLSCARTIYNEHQRLSGNGYQAWTTYDQYCSRDVEHYIQDCFPNYSRSSTSNSWLEAKSNTWLSAAPNAVTPDKSNPWLRASSKQLSAHASTNTPSATASASANAHATAVSYTPPSAKNHSTSFGSSYSTQQRGKIYERCELAQELYNKHNMPMEQVPTWVCIAQHESNFDTSAVGRRNADGSADHGLFQISDLYWCGHDHYSGGKACSMECTKLLDNDISDDVRCIKRIHNEHTGITGDGFMAWSVYDQYCRDQQYDYIAACFKEQAYEQTAETNLNTTTLLIPTPHIYHANPYLKHVSVPENLTHTTPHQQQHSYTTTQNQTAKGKIYKRCELAQELLFKHKFPMQDIATWVCIAQYESNFNTAAVGRLSGGGSADHGLFQISDLYWCGHDALGGKACNISCALLLDNDLSDDVECARRIHEEHTRLSGDGFTAWTVYNGRCRNQEYAQIADCFDSSNEISKTQTFSTSTQVADKHKNRGGLALAQGKIYGECELAQELYYKHGLPLKDISTWVCIAKHESSFKTAAVGHRNADGSADHGLFQISDLYWCAHEAGERGKGCKIPCDKLLDADISDDLRCAQTIYAKHARISGDGFTAWRVYNRNCSSAHLARVSHCFPADVVKKAQTDADKSNNAVQTSSSAVGKIYKKCELAQELYFKHKMPMKDVPTWVCIAEHESRFNTAAVGRGNADGSADHGLFQISDLYWCAHEREGGKACHISCDKLLDNDITDDMRCAKTIFDEHTRLTGDGFTAWTVYERECRDRDLEQLSSCFDSKEWESAKLENSVRQSEQIYRLNAITNVTQGELNHPFLNNPFLNQFSAMKVVPFIPVQITTTTERPIIQYTSKTGFLDNPFLSALIHSHHSMKTQAHTTSERPILTQIPQAPNPFLNNNANKKSTTTPARQKETEIYAHYKNNPFLHNFVAIQQSTVTKASAQLKPKTRTTPGSTSKTKTHIGLSKLYVNSEMFRTTPVKTRVTLDQLNLIPEANTPAIVFKKAYVNSEMFRTTPVRAQISAAQLSSHPETLITSTVSSDSTNKFITPLTSDKIGPSKNIFSNNPFLNKFMQSPHKSAAITTTTKTHINTKSSEPSNASYAFNLLNKSTTNEIGAQTSAPQTQNKQKQNYKSNPFLNNSIVQTSSLTGTTTNKNKITTITAPQKNTQTQYQFNPFLQKFSASALNAATTKVSAQREQAHITPSSFTELQTAFTKPPVNSELFSTTDMRTPATLEGLDGIHQTQEPMTAETPQYSSKTAFLHNPFLNKFVQSHSSNAAITTYTHFNPAPPKPSSAPYVSNPFLNKPSQSDIKIETFASHTQNNQKQNYESNRFLNKYIDQSLSSAFIAPDKLKTKTTPTPQVLYNPFLQNFSASSKASAQQNEKTLTTPRSTKKTTKYFGPSKPYVNSEMFRTTPVKPQTAFQPVKPVLEAQKLYNSFSKPYINTEMFRTTPGEMEASLEQPKSIYERQKPSIEKSVTFTTSNKLLPSTVSATTTQKPRTQTTKQYISTTTTTKKQTSYDRTQELNRQNPIQAQPTKSPVTQTSVFFTKTQIPTKKNKTNVGTTTVRTTKLASTQKLKTVINSAFKTSTAYTTRKPMNLTTADISQQKQASLSTTALGSTRDPNIRQKPRTTTSRPNTNLSVSKTTTTNTKNTAETTTKRTQETGAIKITRKPTTTMRTSTTGKTTTQRKTTTTKTVKQQYMSKTTTRKPTTTAKASTTPKTTVINKITTRPTTAYQKATTQSTTKTVQKQYASKTTTRKPTTMAKVSTTRKTTVINKTTTRPTTAYQKATAQSTTKTLQKQYASKTTTRKPITTTRTSTTQKTTITTKPAIRPTTTAQKAIAKAQLQHYDSSTRRPTTTVRTSTTARTTQHTSFVSRNYLSTTTNVPYTTTKKNITNSFNKYNKNSQATTTTKRPFTGTPTTPRTTTRKPVSSGTFQNKTNATTKTTVPSKATTSKPYRNDPFSHPFFAKFNQKFNAITSTTKGTTIKPTTSTTKYKSQTRLGVESEYYQHFKNHTAGNVQTTYAYAFGKNSTLALNKGR